MSKLFVLVLAGLLMACSPEQESSKPTHYAPAVNETRIVSLAGSFSVEQYAPYANGWIPVCERYGFYDTLEEARRVKAARDKRNKPMAIVP